MKNTPNYEDVEEEESNITSKGIFHLISKGYSDINIGLMLDCSAARVARAKRWYKKSYMEQVGKVVLKDGRVIRLSPDMAEKLGMIVMFSPLTKRIRIGKHEVFTIQDIVTDPEEIARLAQVSLDLGSFAPVSDKRGHRKLKKEELS